MKIIISTLLMLMFSLSGCTTIKENPELANLGIQYATIKLVNRSDNPAESASRVKALSEFIISIAESEPEISAVFLKRKAEELIAERDLAPEDVLLAQALMTAISLEINRRVTDKVLPADTVVTIVEVLTIVRNTVSSMEGT